MNVRFSPTGLYSRVSGTPKELNELENTLDRWAGQHVVGASTVRVWSPGGLADEIWVLTGALLDLKRGAAPPSSSMDEAATALVHAGLLRDYQGDAVKAAIRARLGRGIVEAPAGAGKTRMAAGIIACGSHLGICEWAYLVQNRELARQTERAFAEVLPKMLEVLGEADVLVTCGSYGTIDEAALVRAQGIIVDECVPKGTLIGSHPIETLQIGDVVPSLDTNTGEAQMRRVSRVFQRKPGSDRLVRIWASDGRSLILTPNHPVFAQNGWIPALAITGGCAMLGTDWRQKHVRMPKLSGANWTRTGSILRRVPRTAKESPRSACGSHVQRMRGAGRTVWKNWVGTVQKGISVLLQVMQRKVDGSLSQAARTTRLFGAFRGELQADAREESDAGQQGTRSCWYEDTLEGLARACSARRERAGAAIAAAYASGCSAMGTRVAHPDGDASRIGLSNFVQGGPRGSRSQGGYRDRWVQSCGAARAARQEEGRHAAWIGVDRVEVLQQTSDGTFGGLCPDGLVYNLEVEADSYDDAAYLANGFLIHNCHGLAARTRAKSFARARSALWKFGMSATPLKRQDAGNALVIGLLGPVVYSVDPKLLIDKGFLSKGRFHVVCL